MLRPVVVVIEVRPCLPFVEACHADHCALSPRPSVAEHRGSAAMAATLRLRGPQLHPLVRPPLRTRRAPHYASVLPACRRESPEGLVDRGGRREGRGHVRVKEVEVAALPEALVVFAPNAAAEVVLRKHLVVSDLALDLLHTSSFRLATPRER